jgi:hypothetical protein
MCPFVVYFDESGVRDDGSVYLGILAGLVELGTVNQEPPHITELVFRANLEYYD